MTVLAGVDVGNATTEVVFVSGGEILGAGRVPTRGRKGSADSLRGAAALVRRLERQLGCAAAEARIAPLRPVETSVVTVPATAAPAGRLRVLAAGVPTPGGTGDCIGPPLLLPGPEPAAEDPVAKDPVVAPVVAVVPAGLGYDAAAARLRDLLAGGTPIGAVLVAGDEGVLVANRIPRGLPVIDQVDAVTAAACALLAVEVRPPGHPLNLLADPVALGARLRVSEQEAVGAAAALADQSNAVLGLLRTAPPPEAVNGEPVLITADGERLGLRAACARLAGWPVGAVRRLGTAEVDDLFAVDLAAAAEAATARQGSTSRAILVASLSRLRPEQPAAGLLQDLLAIPVRCTGTEPAAAWLGALTTPGARDGAVVVDLGAGTVDVIGHDASVTAAGAGELLTAAVAETLGIPRAAADWVKRGPCVRVDGGHRFEAEDGTRGFLDRSVPEAAGMLAVAGPGGLLPFGRRHGPGEWRAIRLRLKQAILAANLQRAIRTFGQHPAQVIVVGGPAGDEELLAVLARSLPPGVPVGRGHVGGTRQGTPLGHRYAVALGLCLT